MDSVIERKLAVARGYEQIARRYTEAKRESAAVDLWIERLESALPATGRLLDLGCGAAIPYTRRLAGRFTVTGLDIARAQLRLARGNLPGAALTQGDLCTLPFAEETFDGVLCLYAAIHVPRTEHPRILTEARRVLRPGAPLLIVLGAGSVAADWEEYHGVLMHWSHYGAEVNRRLLEGAGFLITGEGRVPDPDGGAHAFFLATRI